VKSTMESSKTVKVFSASRQKPGLLDSLLELVGFSYMPGLSLTVADEEPSVIEDEPQGAETAMTEVLINQLRSLLKRR